MGRLCGQRWQAVGNRKINNGSCWSRSFALSGERTIVVGRGMTLMLCRTVCCGYSARVRSGLRCRQSIRRTKPAIVAYDSDALGQQMREYGGEMISPNRVNRKRRTQDGRPLRCYRRRRKIERIVAGMQIYRRLVTRWEFHIESFVGFVQLACLLTLLKHL